MVALIPRNPNVVVQGYDGAKWLTEMPDKMNKNIKLKEMECIKYLYKKKRVLFWIKAGANGNYL